WVPNQLIPKTGKIVTQYDMSDLADMGFVKFDFLALSTLTQIAQCIELIGYDPFPEIMDYQDEKTYELINKGYTDGVFQLTGYTAKQVVQKMGGCHNFNDIAVVMALGRP